MSDARPPRTHYLRANQGERSPHRLLILDTETGTEAAPTRELLPLRLWAARLVNRHGHAASEPRTADFWGRQADEAIDLIEEVARARDPLWVYAHNLSFDLTTTRLPLRLLDEGWKLGRHNLASEAPWAYLKKGTRRVQLADSFSWLTASVKLLGQLLELPKPELPAEDDSEAAWLERCQADVRITATAIERLMDEWDRLRLGWWSLTGPATAWNSMLHMAPRRHTTWTEPAREGRPAVTKERWSTQPVIRPDPQAQAFERRAIYSGRRDVWRWGQLPDLLYADLDFRLAHLTICACHTLPDKRREAFDQLPLDDWRIGSAAATVIAECLVSTESPRYPLRWKSAVLHPVGRFRTVLCGPELAEARARGDLLEVGAGWSYRLGGAMKPWAQWAWDQLREDRQDVDPMLRVFLKGASRAVPGRWGMQVARERSRGPSHVNGWGLELAAFGLPPQRGFIVHLAGEWAAMVRDQEGDDAFPAVLAHIQAWDRIYMQRLLDALGECNVVQVNTDAALVRADRLAELARARFDRLGPVEAGVGELGAGALEASEATRPLVARVKAVGRSGRVLSPQHLEHAGARKFAGVPFSAEEVAPDVFQFWTWPKLAGQMERGDPRGYVRELRRVDLTAVPVNRWAYLDGCCEPVRADLGADGATVLLGAGREGCAAHGAGLRDLQHPVLRGLL